MSPGRLREMVDREHPKLSIVRQCAPSFAGAGSVLGVSLSSLYYRPKAASEEDLSLMGEIDRQYLETPFYGSRRMRAWLGRRGIQVSRKRVQRLMRAMGMRAIYRRPGTSRKAPEHRVYPYLLRNARITRPNQSLPPTPIGGVGSGHHLPAHGPGVPVPGGDHGLAQPVRGGLATVQHPPIRVGGRLWTPAFAPGRWKRLWARASRRCSTPTREASSRVGSSPRSYKSAV